jgi:hypothetical protein
VAPGEEAQIDYGFLGSWRDPVGGRVRRVWGFVMVMACSRHMFVRPVLRLDARSWVAAHVAGFAFFGGVPRRLVIDNLRTGVDRADLYDPKLNRAYAELAEHYGTLIDPARRAKPKDKPRVERPMPYIRDSLWRGRDWAGEPDMQAGAVSWCTGVAGVRAHRGLDGAAPLAVFEAVEAAALGPLPGTPFELAAWSTPKVGPDCLLLTELTRMFPHVRALIGVWGSTVRARDRRRGGAPRPGGVGGSRCWVVACNGQPVGAVSVDRPLRCSSRGGHRVLPRLAGRGTRRGHGPLLWDGSAALVSVPVGDRGAMGSGGEDRGS